MAIGLYEIHPVIRTRAHVALVRAAVGGCAIAILVLAGGASTNQAYAAQGSIVRVGSAVPDIPMTMVEAGRISPRDFAGRPVWLNFFATWCAPCKAEMPEIELRSRRFSGSRLAIIGIDEQESNVAVARFAAQRHLSFPLVVDDGAIADRFGVNALPTSVFVDAHGIVRRVGLGQLAPREMDEALNAIGVR